MTTSAIQEVTANMTLEQLLNLEAVEQHLIKKGISPVAANEKGKLFAKCAQHLLQEHITSTHSVNAFFIPGRIEILGKHTDYAGGKSLITSIERGMCIISSPRKDRKVTITDISRNVSAELSMSQDLPDANNWINYPTTVIRRICKNFPEATQGADIVLASNLPSASGLSSSSVFMIGIFLALARANNLYERPAYQENINSNEDLAGYLATIENGQTYGTLHGEHGVGTFGGSEDHTAILCCKPNQVSLYSYCPVKKIESIDWPQDLVFIIGCTGISANKTGNAKDKYNQASLRCQAIIDLYNQATQKEVNTLAAIAKSADGNLEKMKQLLNNTTHSDYSPEELFKRYEQFYQENQVIIPEAIKALKRYEYLQFGEYTRQSHDLAESHLNNQTIQNNFLINSAKELDAIACSSFGAGFGGSVWAILPFNHAKNFMDQWQTNFIMEYPDLYQRAAFFQVEPGPAAFELNL